MGRSVKWEMRELIYHDDCDLNAPSLDRDGMIRDLMAEYSLNWNECDEDKVFEFAVELMEKAQNIIDTAPTITTDEVMAYKCPECKVVSILYDPEHELWCPNCGIGRIKYGNS